MSSQRLQRVSLFLLLTLIPTNLGKHFVFNFSYVIGSPVDYLIPTLYLTDIFLLLIFCLYFFGLLVDQAQRQRFLKNLKTGSAFFMIFFLLVSLPNIDIRNLPGAWYKWVRLLEMSFFASYISLHFDFLKNFYFLTRALSFSVLYESILAILQWKNQGSVFGYYFLGESSYSAATFDAPYANFFGQKFLRSYGTLPHPNILGGFLALALPLLLVAFLKSKRRGIKGYYLFAILLGFLGLFFSFSRTAWAVSLLGLFSTLVYYSTAKKKRPFDKVWFLSFLVSFPLLGLIFTAFFAASRLSLTLSAIQRYELAQIAARMFLANPLFGVGLNNFVVRLAEFGEVTSEGRFLQPVHNIYLLVAAEAGILGILGFLALLMNALQALMSKIRSLAFYGYLLITFFQLLLLGLFDHYLLTLPPGLLLFFFVLGMSFKTR